MPSSQNKRFAFGFSRLGEFIRDRSAFHAAAIFLFLGMSANAGEMEDILARVSAAYGGETASQGIKGVRQTGVTYSALRSMEGQIMRAYQPPDRLRIEIHYPDGDEVRILIGPHAWKQSQPMSGPFHGALVLQAKRMALPWNLLEARDQLQDKGEVQIDGGMKLRVLEWKLGDGLIMEIGIEPESGRIIRSLGKVPGSMGVMEFGTLYEDFRTQNGRLYAARERHFALGQASGYTRIEQVEFLEKMPDSLFVPPAPGTTGPGDKPPSSMI